MLYLAYDSTNDPQMVVAFLNALLKHYKHLKQFFFKMEDSDHAPLSTND